MRFKNVTIMLAVLVSMALLAGCTDVPSSAPPPIEVNSEYIFVNADVAQNSLSINFDLGPAVSGLSFGAASNAATYPSGARVGVTGSGDTLNVAMTTDQKGTIVILTNTAGFPEFVKLITRRVFDSAATTSASLNLSMLLLQALLPVRLLTLQCLALIHRLLFPT